MLRAAAIFPGQGSEYPGMLSCIRKVPITDEVFGRIKHVAGKDILEAAESQTDHGLSDPVISQLAIFGASACYWHLLSRKEDFQSVAGHSLGFYAALYASDAISLEDCAGIIMNVQTAIESVSGNRSGLMASIMGLRTEQVQEICTQLDDVYISNINSTTQTVISGWKDAVQAACSMALEDGALTVKELAISYPLHSPLMNGIEDMIRQVVAPLEIKEPRVPVISHIDSRPLHAEDIAHVLSMQLTKQVRWRDTVKAIRQEGINRFVEVGPSDVLSKLVRWIERDAQSFRAEELVPCQTL
ncbi:MAG: ACP S-malonyltransferase [Nitrospirota bacterium]|nr:ACP S-malonyltransferase [Nitrospirota bacterium]